MMRVTDEERVAQLSSMREAEFLAMLTPRRHNIDPLTRE